MGCFSKVQAPSRQKVAPGKPPDVPGPVLGRTRVHFWVTKLVPVSELEVKHIKSMDTKPTYI